MCGGSGKGDQLVEIRVVTPPQKLTAQQKELLRDFAKSGGAELPEENKSFFRAGQGRMEITGEGGAAPAGGAAFHCLQKGGA